MVSFNVFQTVGAVMNGYQQIASHDGSTDRLSVVPPPILDSAHVLALRWMKRGTV
jgi:hypothetical protein